MSNKNSSNKTGYALLVLAFVVALIALLYYNSQINGSSANQLAAYSSHYNSLQNNYSALQGVLNMTSIKLANLSVHYNATKYNLTHPYVNTLYSGYIFALNPEIYNYTYGSWIPGQYNFSFNAPYPGYIVLNYSVAPSNQSVLSSTFEIFVSREKPYYTNATLEFNSYTYPYTKYAGPSGSTTIIPVTNGTNYVEIFNYQNKTATVDLSVKYFGLHTS
jgi:hypothetical protein